MIKQESLAKLLVRLKIAPDEAAAKEIITAKEEKEVTVPEGLQLFSKEELETRDKSTKSSSIQAGIEIGVKALKEQVGLTYEGEGSKDPKKFVEEFQKKVLADANVNVDEKVGDRDKTITKLRETIKTMESEQEKNAHTAKSAKQDYDLLTWTHDLKPENLEDKEWVTLLKMNNELVEDNGGLFVKRNGEIVKDQKLQTPVAAKDAIRGFIADRKLGKDTTAATAAAAAASATGGRGAGDSRTNTGGITNMTQFNEHIQKNNIDPKSAEAQALLTKTSGANANFDFNH